MLRSHSRRWKRVAVAARQIHRRRPGRSDTQRHGTRGVRPQRPRQESDEAVGKGDGGEVAEPVEVPDQGLADADGLAALQ